MNKKREFSWWGILLGLLIHSVAEVLIPSLEVRLWLFTAVAGGLGAFYTLTASQYGKSPKWGHAMLAMAVLAALMTLILRFL